MKDFTNWLFLYRDDMEEDFVGDAIKISLDDSRAHGLLNLAVVVYKRNPCYCKRLDPLVILTDHSNYESDTIDFGKCAVCNIGTTLCLLSVLYQKNLITTISECIVNLYKYILRDSQCRFDRVDLFAHGIEVYIKGIEKDLNDPTCID